MSPSSSCLSGAAWGPRPSPHLSPARMMRTLGQGGDFEYLLPLQEAKNKKHVLKIMNDQGKYAKPQRSPWILRINFNFPLIWIEIATSVLEGLAQPWGRSCAPLQHPETPAPNFGCIPEPCKPGATGLKLLLKGMRLNPCVPVCRPGFLKIRFSSTLCF